MKSQTHDGRETWRAAILSYDRNTSQNIISYRIVTEVLNIQMRLIDQDTKGHRSLNSYGEEIAGIILLEWRLEGSRELGNRTWFYVTTTDNPAYDVVVGRDAAEKYGLHPRSAC